MNKTKMPVHAEADCFWLILPPFLQSLFVPFACVGSSDPVRVLHLYTTNTLDTL